MLFVSMLFSATAMLTPAWSIDAWLDSFDAAVSRAEAARPVVESHSAGDGAAFDAVFGRACLLDDEAFWQRARPFLPPASAQIDDRIARMRSRLMSWLEMQDPPGTVFAAAGYRYPEQTRDTSEALIARAQFDQLIRAFHTGYLADGGTDGLEAAISLALVCKAGRNNAEFLYRLTLREGFPSHADYGYAAENAAFLIAKHMTDDGQAAFVTASAGFAAGAQRVSRTSYGYLLDSFAINLLEGQLLGTYVRCEDGQAISDPPIIDPAAAAFWRTRLAVPDRDTLDRLACPGREGR